MEIRDRHRQWKKCNDFGTWKIMTVTGKEVEIVVEENKYNLGLSWIKIYHEIEGD